MRNTIRPSELGIVIQRLTEGLAWTWTSARKRVTPAAPNSDASTAKEATNAPSETLEGEEEEEEEEAEEEVESGKEHFR